MYINSKDTEGLITNEQSKDTGNTGHKTQNENKKITQKAKKMRNNGKRGLNPSVSEG
jgi:hypothetical protein